jgi:hypothetical protein
LRLLWNTDVETFTFPLSWAQFNRITAEEKLQRQALAHFLQKIGVLANPLRARRHNGILSAATKK